MANSPSETRSAAAPLLRWSPEALAVAWMALVAVAVVGRLWRPEWNGTRLWNVTPFVAVALAAAALFPRRLVAATVPLAALALGNVALPGYDSPWVTAVVFAAIAFPALLGGLVRRGRWPAVLAGSLAGSLVFFLTTNVAHWAATGDYPKTAAGLVACYAAGLPFFRPLEDLAWTGVVFGGLAVADRIGAALATRGAAVAKAPAAPAARLD
ncbi:MAG: DUF6580 family putative transport protein [Planctomycetaceae bacterium]